MIIRNKISHIVLLLTLVLAMSRFDCMAYEIYENHVILALDARNEMQLNPDNWSNCKNIIKNKLPRMLKNQNVESGIVSTIVFSIPELDSNLDNYIKKHKVAEPFNLDNIDSYWEQLSKVSLDGNRFSLLSIAKPYSLMALKAEDNDDAMVERTYLVLVSDLKYNGNDDFYDELRHKPNVNSHTLNSILNNVKNVQQNYFYSFIDQVELPRGYLMLFECIPQQKYFALESVVDYPHEVTARRTKAGYIADVKISSFDNPNYELIDIEGRHKTSEPKRLEGFGVMTFLLGQDAFQTSDTIHIDLKARVRLIDNIYNRTVLTADGSELQGANGLNKQIIAKKEDNAKILGMIPLTDFLFKISFWTDNQQIAAVSWSIVFIIILIAVVLLIVRNNLKFRNDGTFKAFSKK